MERWLFQKWEAMIQLAVVIENKTQVIDRNNSENLQRGMAEVFLLGK